MFYIMLLQIAFFRQWVFGFNYFCFPLKASNALHNSRYWPLVNQTKNCSKLLKIICKISVYKVHISAQQKCVKNNIFINQKICIWHLLPTLINITCKSILQVKPCNLPPRIPVVVVLAVVDGLLVVVVDVVNLSPKSPWNRFLLCGIFGCVYTNYNHYPPKNPPVQLRIRVELNQIGFQPLRINGSRSGSDRQEKAGSGSDTRNKKLPYSA